MCLSDHLSHVKQQEAPLYSMSLRRIVHVEIQRMASATNRLCTLAPTPTNSSRALENNTLLEQLNWILRHQPRDQSFGDGANKPPPQQDDALSCCFSTSSTDPRRVQDFDSTLGYPGEGPIPAVNAALGAALFATDEYLANTRPDHKRHKLNPMGYVSEMGAAEAMGDFGRAHHKKVRSVDNPEFADRREARENKRKQFQFQYGGGPKDKPIMRASNHKGDGPPKKSTGAAKQKQKVAEKIKREVRREVKTMAKVMPKKPVTSAVISTPARYNVEVSQGKVSVVVEHMEQLAEIWADSGVYSCYRFTFNPANAATLTWIATGIGNGFEKFEYEPPTSILYQPEQGTNVSGAFIRTKIDDINVGTFVSAKQQVEYGGSSTAAMNLPWVWPLTGLKSTYAKKSLIRNNGDDESATDPHLFDPWFVQISTEGLPAPTLLVGKLYFKYKVRLTNPRAFPVPTCLMAYGFMGSSISGTQNITSGYLTQREDDNINSAAGAFTGFPAPACGPAIKWVPNLPSPGLCTGTFSVPPAFSYALINYVVQNSYSNTSSKSTSSISGYANLFATSNATLRLPDGSTPNPNGTLAAWYAIAANYDETMSNANINFDIVQVNNPAFPVQIILTAPSGANLEVRIINLSIVWLNDSDIVNMDGVDAALPTLKSSRYPLRTISYKPIGDLKVRAGASYTLSKGKIVGHRAVGPVLHRPLSGLSAVSIGGDVGQSPPLRLQPKESKDRKVSVPEDNEGDDYYDCDVEIAKDRALRLLTEAGYHIDPPKKRPGSHKESAANSSGGKGDGPGGSDDPFCPTVISILTCDSASSHTITCWGELKDEVAEGGHYWPPVDHPNETRLVNDGSQPVKLRLFVRHCDGRHGRRRPGGHSTSADNASGGKGDGPDDARKPKPKRRAPTCRDCGQFHGPNKPCRQVGALKEQNVCRHFLKTGSCRYAEKCRFSHLRVDDILDEGRERPPSPPALLPVAEISGPAQSEVKPPDLDSIVVLPPSVPYDDLARLRHYADIPRLVRFYDEKYPFAEIIDREIGDDLYTSLQSTVRLLEACEAKGNFERQGPSADKLRERFQLALNLLPERVLRPPADHCIAQHSWPVCAFYAVDPFVLPDAITVDIGELEWSDLVIVPGDKKTFDIIGSRLPPTFGVYDYSAFYDRFVNGLRFDDPLYDSYLATEYEDFWFDPPPPPPPAPPSAPSGGGSSRKPPPKSPYGGPRLPPPDYPPAPGRAMEFKHWAKTDQVAYCEDRLFDAACKRLHTRVYDRKEDLHNVFRQLSTMSVQDQLFDALEACDTLRVPYDATVDAFYRAVIHSRDTRIGLYDRLTADSEITPYKRFKAGISGANLPYYALDDNKYRALAWLETQPFGTVDQADFSSTAIHFSGLLLRDCITSIGEEYLKVGLWLPLLTIQGALIMTVIVVLAISTLETSIYGQGMLGGISRVIAHSLLSFFFWWEHYHSSYAVAMCGAAGLHLLWNLCCTFTMRRSYALQLLPVLQRPTLCLYEKRVKSSKLADDFKIKYGEPRCVDDSFVQCFGGIYGFEPTVHRSCIHNEKVALEGRVGKWIPAIPLEDEINDHWSSEISRVLPTLLGQIDTVPRPQSLEAWLAHLDPAKRRLYLSFLEAPDLLFQGDIGSCFIKRELAHKNLYDDDRIEKDPRWIQGAPPHLILKTGKWLKLLGARVAEGLRPVGEDANYDTDFVDAQQFRYGKHVVYTYGLTGEQVGEALRQGLAAVGAHRRPGDRVVILEDDQSRFDMHIRRGAFGFLNRVYSRKLGRRAARYLQRRWLKGVSKLGTKFSSPTPQMQSGWPDTSIGDTLINAFMKLCIHGLYNPWVSIICGDDSVTIMLESDLARLGGVQGIVASYARFGMEVEAAVRYEVAEVEFCSSSFRAIGDSFVLMPRTGKILARILWDFELRSPKERYHWVWSIGHTLSYYGHYDVLFASLGRALLRVGVQNTDKVWLEPEYKLRLDRRYNVDDVDKYRFFMDRYDLSANEVDRLVPIVGRMFGNILQDDTLEAMAQRDL